MSKPRSLKPKTDLSLVTEDPTLTTPVPDGTDPETLPFPEFSDQDINAEKWDLSGLPKDKLTPSQPRLLFEDPQKIHLPPGYSAMSQWKRCSEVYSNANFVVFTNISEYPDLITPNQHLLNNEFYRDFISCIEALLYIGCTKPFPTEYENAGFYGAGSRPWRPWHNIYSNCKITKGEHLPAFNPSGKYVVRLFLLGTWRKIYVDDMVPVDVLNNVLLPSLHIPKSTENNSIEDIFLEKPGKGGKIKGTSPIRKEIIELWPMILSKALLKIGSLSTCRLTKSNDFDIINCLTGWVPQRIKTRDISSSNLWDIFMAYVEHFEWDDYKEESIKKTGGTKTKSKAKDIPDTPKKGAKGVIPSGIETMRDGDRFVVLSCNSFEPLETNEPSPNRNLSMFLSQVRDIPIIQPPPRPELEFWKTFRYEQWAVEQGILPPDIKKLNIQSLQIVDPFRRILRKPEIENALANANLSNQDVGDNGDQRSEKSTKSSKKTTKSTKTAALLEPDPSMWIDFCDIQPTIDYLTIYFQPRAFRSKTIISDISFTNKPAEFRQVVSPFILKETRNEPIYMLVDSIDFKLVVINLAQMGDISMLDKINEDEETIEGVEKSEDLMDICDEIIFKKTKKDASKTSSEMDRKYSICELKLQPASLVLEEYCWESNSMGQPLRTISTLANRSIIIDLKPGRVSFRLWISSSCTYALQVLCDTAVTIGCLEQYLIDCSKESQLLMNLCYELSSCYGKLVQSFGMPDYSESLRNFYRCYKPFQRLSKRELATVHKAFFEEFYKIIVENCNISAAADSVKLLFLQLKTFDYLNPYTEEPHLYPEKFPVDDQIEYAKLMQRSAVLVQAFFKRIYVRLLMNKMDEEHKQYYNIFDILKRIYIELFSADKRLTYCPTNVRRFFEREEMQALNNKFEIYHDLQSVLALYVYNGTLIIQEPSWVPICRFEFFVTSTEAIFIKINLFCNLKTYTLRVFDNDNLREIKQLNNDVIVEKYCQNTNGYTILAYGWSNDQAKVNWKLVIASKKMSRNDLVTIPAASIATLSLTDNYLPNFDNVICRHIVKVAYHSFLTANLTTSYDQVRLSLRLLNKEGKLLHEVFGVKSALFPLVYLRCGEDVTRQNSVQFFYSMPSGLKKRPSTHSGTSEISYSKLTKKYLSGDGRYSSASRRSSTDGDEDTGHRRHRRRSSAENVDVDDDLSNASLRYENEPGASTYVRKSPSKGSRSSLPSKSRNSTRGGVPSSSNRGVENARTEYILEARVVGNSWPLTADEWNRVQKLRQKSNLNLIDDRRVSTKKMPVPRKTLSSLLEDPYWTLDLVFDAANPAEFQEDHSKDEKRKETKKKWFADVERYKRGNELRRTYVEEKLVLRGETTIDKDARSNDPKDFATQVIVGENLEKYMIKPLEEVDEDYCKTKHEDDYIIEEAHLQHNIKEYAEGQRAAHEETEAQLLEQKENFAVLSKWFEGIRHDSAEMLNEAIAVEKEYVRRATQASTKGKYDKKDKGKNKK